MDARTAQGTRKMFRGTVGGQARVVTPSERRVLARRTRGRFWGITDRTFFQAGHEDTTSGDLVIDNRTAGYRAIVVAGAVHPDTATISHPGEGVVVRDATDHGARQFFQVIDAPSASVFTWSASLPSAMSCTAVGWQRHRIGHYSVDNGYGATPAPTWASVTLGAGEDLYGLVVADGDPAWLTDPKGIALGGNPAPGAGGWPTWGAATSGVFWTTELLGDVVRPANGPTGSMVGANGDGNRPWATLLLTVRPEG